MLPRHAARVSWAILHVDGLSSNRAVIGVRATVRCRCGRSPLREFAACNRDNAPSSGRRRGPTGIGVQLSSGVATQAGAGPTQVMRGQILNGGSFGAVPYDMPDDPFRYTGPPGLSCAANAPKHAALAHAGGYKPRIDGPCQPNPRWPNGPSVVEGGRRPVLLPLSGATRNPGGSRAMLGLAGPSAYSGQALARAILPGRPSASCPGEHRGSSAP